MRVLAAVDQATRRAELIEQRLQEPRFRASARMIRRSAEHLNQLLTGILDFAKMEAGAMPINTEAVALRALVEDTVGVVPHHRGGVPAGPGRHVQAGPAAAGRSHLVLRPHQAMAVRRRLAPASTPKPSAIRPQVPGSGTAEIVSHANVCSA